MNAAPGRADDTPVGWLELFNDLVFVGGVTLIADEADPSVPAYATTWVLVAGLGLFAIWLSTTLAFNQNPMRVGSDEPFTSNRNTARTLPVFLQMGALVIAVVSVSESAGLANSNGFLAMGVVAATAAGLISLIETPGGRHDVRRRRSAWLMAGAAACLFAGCPLIDTGGAGILFVVSLLLTSASLAIRLGSKVTPVRAHHLQERLGLLMLIVIGESFVALSAGFSRGGQMHDFLAFCVVLCTPMVFFTIYFGPAAPDRGGYRNAALWIVAQFLALYTVAAAGKAMAYRLIEPDSLEIEGSSFRVAVRIAGFLVSMAAICWLSERSMREPPWIYLGGAAVIMAVHLFGPTLGLSALSEMLTQVAVLFAVATFVTVLASLQTNGPGAAERNA